MHPIHPTTDAQVLAAMRECGEGYVQALADPKHVPALKLSLPQLWELFSTVAALRVRPQIIGVA